MGPPRLGPTTQQPLDQLAGPYAAGLALARVEGPVDLDGTPSISPRLMRLVPTRDRAHDLPRIRLAVSRGSPRLAHPPSASSVHDYLLFEVSGQQGDGQFDPRSLGVTNDGMIGGPDDIVAAP